MVYWFNGSLVSGSNPTCFETALMFRNTYMHNPLSGISTSSLNSTMYIMQYFTYAYHQVIERTCTKISGANQVTSSYGNVDLLEHLDVTQVSCPYNPSECVICKFPYGKPICFVVRYSRGLRVQYQKRCSCIFFLRRKRCIF